MRMRTIGCVWLGLALLGTARAEETPAPEPQEKPQILIVDEAHQALPDPGPQRKDKTPKVYEIEPTDAIGLDFRGYELKFRSGDRKFNLMKPNRLDVLFDNGKQYKRIYSSKRQKRLELSAKTLRPVGNTPRFEGFKAGQRFMVSLGYEFPRLAKEDEGKVAPAWMGVVEVVPGPEPKVKSEPKAKTPPAKKDDAPMGDF